MVKLVFLCRRRPDITHACYTTRLLEGHVPLALAHHPTMRRYVVNIVEHAAPGARELDSIGELWFDTVADFHERLYDSPDGERVIARDVARFIGAADGYVTREEAAPSPPSPGSTGAAWMLCLRRGAGPGPETVAEHMAAGVAGVQTCVVSRVDAALAPSAPAYDAFVTVRLAACEPAAAGVVLARLQEIGSIEAYRVAFHVRQ
jgi:hypothetical protein